MRLFSLMSVIRTRGFVGKVMSRIEVMSEWVSRHNQRIERSPR